MDDNGNAKGWDLRDLRRGGEHRSPSAPHEFDGFLIVYSVGV